MTVLRRSVIDAVARISSMVFPVGSRDLEEESGEVLWSRDLCMLSPHALDIWEVLLYERVIYVHGKFLKSNMCFPLEIMKI